MRFIDQEEAWDLEELEIVDIGWEVECSNCGSLPQAEYTTKVFDGWHHKIFCSGCGYYSIQYSWNDAFLVWINDQALKLDPELGKIWKPGGFYVCDD